MAVEAPSTPIPADAGIGLRAVHFEAVLERCPAVPWFEFHSENFLGYGAPFLYLERIRAAYPLSMHGVGLSLGDAAGLDLTHLARLADLAQRIEPGLISEHLSFARVGSAYLNDLLPLPYTEEALTAVVRNVDQAQTAFGRQILVENASAYLTYATSSMPEHEFLVEVCRRSGAKALLDVNNVYVNARNHNFDASAYLAAFPTDIVGEIHLAGHAVNRLDDGQEIRIDDHGSHVDDAVWTLYQEALTLFGARPTLIEWDTRIPSLETLEAEAARARTFLQQHAAAFNAA
jgi:uncharacterized protein (UPF0276 family)